MQCRKGFIQLVLGATGTVLGVSREYLAVPEQTNCAGSVHQHPGRSHGDSDSGRSQGCCGRYGHRGQAVPGTHLCLGKKGKRSELCQGYRECLAWAGQGMEAGHEWGSSRGHKGRDPATAWAQGCWVADVLTPPTPAQPQPVHSAPSTRAVSTTGYPEHVCTRQQQVAGHCRYSPRHRLAAASRARKPGWQRQVCAPGVLVQSWLQLCKP